MVWGVTFRSAIYLAIAGFVTAILDGPMLFMLSFAGHEDHWWIAGMTVLLENAVPIVVVLSAGIMVAANALTRRQGVGV